MTCGPGFGITRRSVRDDREGCQQGMLLRGVAARSHVTGDHEEPVSEIARQALTPFDQNDIGRKRCLCLSYVVVLLGMVTLGVATFHRRQRRGTFETGSKGRPYGKRGRSGMMLKWEGGS